MSLPSGMGSERSDFQRPLLRGEQVADAGLAHFQQARELAFRERGFLTRALKLDEFAGRIHDQVEVHARGGVLAVAEVQQRLALDDGGYRAGGPPLRPADPGFCHRQYRP